MADTKLIDTRQARAALKLRDEDSAVDELLASFVEGVTDVLEEEVGWIEPREVTVDVVSRNGSAVLRRTNIRALVSATGPGGDLLLTDGIRVRSDVGIVHGLPDGINTLVLEVGFEQIPQSLRRAAAEILNVAWESQRAPDEARPFLLSYRSEAWFKPHSMGPSIR